MEERWLWPGIVFFVALIVVNNGLDWGRNIAIVIAVLLAIIAYLIVKKRLGD